MRALEHATQVTQQHLNRRRFLAFFTETNGTGSICLVHFQLISEHTQSTSEHNHGEVKGIHYHFTPRILLDACVPIEIIPFPHDERSQELTERKNSTDNTPPTTDAGQDTSHLIQEERALILQIGTNRKSCTSASTKS